ncbi:MAG: dTDP-4-dehydrorhamnose reductase [Holophaga sp.]|nr:dTDP-4-dehydrorhamnose reductase [Holophaga sp.]
MRVLVTGASGQLARAVRASWTDHELVVPAESSLDLGDPDAIQAVVAQVRPQVVLNLGAFTQVDRCEASPEQAMLINGTAVGWLAAACREQGALLVQISTDYVFDGLATRPYWEDDPTGPLSVYGRTKLVGEEQAQLAPEHLIVRTAWLYDDQGRNFYRTTLNAAAQGRALKVVDDQRGTPTSCRALARQLHQAVAGGWRGLVHGTCHGETTWHGFAAEIFRQRGVQASLTPCATADYPLLAPRPAYSVLCGQRRALLGSDLMPSWEEALAEVVAADRP